MLHFHTLSLYLICRGGGSFFTVLLRPPSRCEGCYRGLAFDPPPRCRRSPLVVRCFRRVRRYMAGAVGTRPARRRGGCIGCCPARPRLGPTGRLCSMLCSMLRHKSALKQKKVMFSIECENIFILLINVGFYKCRIFFTFYDKDFQ